MPENLCIQIIKVDHETTTNSNKALVWIVLYFIVNCLGGGIPCHSDWATLITANINDRTKENIITLQEKIFIDY